MSVKILIRRKCPQDKEIQSRIDAIPEVTTEYSIYRYIKTR